MLARRPNGKRKRGKVERKGGSREERRTGKDDKKGSIEDEHQAKMG